MADLNQIHEMLSHLRRAIKAKGYHAHCDFRVGHSQSSDEPYTFKLEGELPQNLRNEVGPIAAHETERVNFIDGEVLQDLYARALDKIESWPSVQDQVLHIIQTKLSQGAELAQAASIADYSQNEAWGALATYLRERAHELARNGLPSPTSMQLSIDAESCINAEGANCPACGSGHTTRVPAGGKICLDCDHVAK